MLLHDLKESIHQLLKDQGYLTNSAMERLAPEDPQLLREAIEELVLTGAATMHDGAGLTCNALQHPDHECAAVGGKQVLLSKPYKPTCTGRLVGRKEETLELLASWMTDGERIPRCPLIIGEAGLGKNRLVYEASLVTGKPLYLITSNDGITPEDLACFVRPRDRNSSEFDYLLSPLATAMIKGGIYFIDEIGKICHKALAVLASVLDERRYLESNLLGERIEAHPGFRFVAATNNSDLVNQALPEFMVSRLKPVIRFKYPPREELLSMVQERPMKNRPDSVPLFDRFIQLAETKGMKVSPRDALQTFGMAINLADYEVAASQPVFSLEAPAPGNVHFRHIEQAFELTRNGAIDGQ
jgi:MoxR-like ATPase